jgi:hypothetical protein
MKDNFIIFIHEYTELDMIMPFIDYVVTKHNVRVTLYTDYKLTMHYDVSQSALQSGLYHNPNISDAACYHLEYLRKYHKIKLKYFLEEQPFRKHRYVLLLHDKVKQFQRRRMKTKKKFSNIDFMISLASMIMIRAAEYIIEKSIKGYVGKLNVSDKILMYFNGEISFPFSAIVDFAKKRDIRTVGYFQGFYIYSNLQVTNKTKSGKRGLKARLLNIFAHRKRVYCACYLAGRTMRATFFSSNVALAFKEVDKILETVTPRFTKGWIKTFRTFLNKKEQFNYGDEKKTNVVFFLSQVKQNVKEREYYDIFNRLSEINNINFVYKSHPRRTIDLGKGYNASNVNSFHLSVWADVCILFGSSIAIHLLLENIPIIVPSFVHTNSTILEKHKICVTANSLDELINILENNTKDDIRKLIDNARVEKFLNKYLDAHKDYEQIMQEYYEAVVSNKLLE